MMMITDLPGWLYNPSHWDNTTVVVYIVGCLLAGVLGGATAKIIHRIWGKS